MTPVVELGGNGGCVGGGLAVNMQMYAQHAYSCLLIMNDMRSHGF